MKNSTIKLKQQGMTLIELMVALALGLFLIAGVMQIFINSKQTYRMQDNNSRLQENARFAMDFITRDIRKADSSGCLRGGINNVNTNNHLNPGGAGYVANIHGFTQGISGTNDDAIIANLIIDGTDTITIRGTMDSGLVVKTPPVGAQTSSDITVTVPPSSNAPAQGDIVLVSDCTQADIFQISNTSNPVAGELVLVHNTANATTPGNLNVTNPTCPGASAHCLFKVYQNDASIYQVGTTTYTIQTGTGGRPALFREINATGATELVEGIENLQILYGLDTNADNTPDYFVPETAAGLNMNQVVSIRVWVLATSIDDNLTLQPVPYFFNGATLPAPDRRIRRAFSSTIAVRNRLP